MSTLKDILERIKGLRIKKGISQTKMAKEIGISQTGYANIEIGGTGTIPLSVAVGIAKVLNVGFNELFDIEGDSQKIDSLNREIEELKEKIEDQKKQISDKELLIRYFSRSNQNVRDYLIKKIRDEFQIKYNELENKYPFTVTKDDIIFDNEEDSKKLNEEIDLLSQTIQDEYQKFISFGVLEQSDVDKFIRFFKKSD